jgi:3-phosphoshikimate 1-carboxyvinyltransferase
MGADIIINENSITVKGSELTGVELDMNKTPDALPAMAVTATFAKGATKIMNVPQARTKETDRIKCMAEELKKMGAEVEELQDGLIIQQSKLIPSQLDGRSDHRIVMALALAGLSMNDGCIIDTAEAMSVTFPTYVDLMRNIGANMEVIN